jgi:S-adenosylmethionine/arginine decarboxylase-like enzyme
LVERQYPYKHIVATFFGCEANLLDKNQFLKTSLMAIEKANMTLVQVPKNPLVYKVDEDIIGGGVGVNALITTSHLTIHSAKDYSPLMWWTGRDLFPTGCKTMPLLGYRTATLPFRIIFPFSVST